MSLLMAQDFSLSLVDWHIVQSDEDILQSEMIISRQRHRVDSLENAGADSSQSRRLLRNFEMTLGLQYADRGRLLRELRY